MSMFKNKKEIAFHIAVCSKIIMNNGKSYQNNQNPSKQLGMVNIQILPSKFIMVGSYTVKTILY